jgi:hypothetical protein
MKQLLLAITLTLASLTTFAQTDEEARDECTLQANIASNILAFKVYQKAPLQAVKQSFANWLNSGPEGVTPEGKELLKTWYNKMGGEGMNKWFTDVYNNYSDPQAAWNGEKAACEQQAK